LHATLRTQKAKHARSNEHFISKLIFFLQLMALCR